MTSSTSTTELCICVQLTNFSLSLSHSFLLMDGPGVVLPQATFCDGLLEFAPTSVPSTAGRISVPPLDRCRGSTTRCRDSTCSHEVKKVGSSIRLTAFGHARRSRTWTLPGATGNGQRATGSVLEPASSGPSPVHWPSIQPRRTLSRLHGEQFCLSSASAWSRRFLEKMGRLPMLPLTRPWFASGELLGGALMSGTGGGRRACIGRVEDRRGGSAAGLVCVLFLVSYVAAHDVVVAGAVALMERALDLAWAWLCSRKSSHFSTTTGATELAAAISDGRECAHRLALVLHSPRQRSSWTRWTAALLLCLGTDRPKQ